MTLKGSSALRRTLQKLPDEITKDVKLALKEAAEVVHADTLQNIPVASGELVRSLHKAKRSNGFVWRVGWWKKGNLKKWRQGGWRALFIEYGTKHQRAQPMLGPAVRNNKRWIIRRVSRAVNKALKRGAKL